MPENQQLQDKYCNNHKEIKTTLCGMWKRKKKISKRLSCGIVDQRTIEKYEKEAKENNRASWFLAYVMDTNEEERAKVKKEKKKKTFVCFCW